MLPPVPLKEFCMKDNKSNEILRDEALVEKTRLSIMLFLLISGRARFKVLQDNLNLSPGNLYTHLKKLESSDLISVKWDLTDTRGRIISITEEGKMKVHSLLDALREYGDNHV